MSLISDGLILVVYPCPQKPLVWVPSVLKQSNGRFHRTAECRVPVRAARKAPPRQKRKRVRPHQNAIRTFLPLPKRTSGTRACVPGRKRPSALYSVSATHLRCIPQVRANQPFIRSPL